VRGEMGNEEMDVMLFFFRATAKWQLLLLFVATKGKCRFGGCGKELISTS
jgi:hypothetical protein